MRVLAGAVILVTALAAPVASVAALTVQEAILRAKPAVALVTSRVDAEVTMNCGRGPVTVKPAPFVETGTGWFIDGRGFVITNAHVVDPAYRLPPWVTHELKKKAIEQACVEPELRRQGIARGQRPDVEDQLRREAAARALPGATITPATQVTVLLSSGLSLPATVEKFSPPALLDMRGRPLPDAGRDLALLRVRDGDYPAIPLSSRSVRIGDPVHILGFPGVVLTHELLSQNATLDASVTNGAISGFRPDVTGQEVIQTDAPATHGNSGGPAIIDDATVVGVLTFVSLSPAGGALVQGFNFLITARDVREFVADTDVRPGHSRFSEVWAAGLSALFGGRYTVAVQRFTEANELQPNLIDVKRNLAEAEERVKNPPPRPFPWAWATLGVSVLSGGAFGAMFGRRWWKNRYRIMPAQVIAAIENGQNPLLVDVRSKTDYETSPLRLPGAVRLEPAAVDAGQVGLDADHDQLVVTYCTTPEEATSARVALRLRERGWKNVRILKGGLGGWTNARLPVEAKSHLPSIGLEIYKSLTLGDLERRRFAPGDQIFSEGADACGEAYVVHAGTVEIRRNFNGEERVLGQLGEGQLLGEMALFRQAPRSANAIAVTDVELLVLKMERLEWLMRNRPQLSMEIVKRMANWVVQTDRDRAMAAR
jgi:S1-C subfamily serine protease/rhodanese-related sulfurtransferase